jgi:hypothetical protein
VLEIPLNSSAAGIRRLRLRTLEGRDELNLDPHGRTGFCDFVRGLAVNLQGGDMPPGQVCELAVCDLELIAATLQCANSGDWVESS